MNELAAFILQLRPLHQARIPVWLGRATHAWFIQSLEAIHPQLVAAAHDGSKLRAATLSNLYGLEGEELAALSTQQTYDLRLTTLHADLTRITQTALVPQWLAGPIHLHDQPFRVESIIWQAEKDPRSGSTSYAALLDAKVGRRVRLYFISPTNFKRSPALAKQSNEKWPELFQPWPDPRLLIQNLAARWNEFSPHPLQHEGAELANYAELLRVVDFQIQGQRVSFERASRGSSVGFIGMVEYEFLPSIPPSIQKQLWALLHFAKYSGVGVKTSMGMGQVWLQ
jgi:CRISPR-associated endoribonuclease Cas6